MQKIGYFLGLVYALKFTGGVQRSEGISGGFMSLAVNTLLRTRRLTL